MWLPKGAAFRRELERFIVDEEIRRGYEHVYTPDIAKLETLRKVWPLSSITKTPCMRQSKSTMKNSCCANEHARIISKCIFPSLASYRELPMRIAELAKLYRYEQSGELMGLQRVRSFCLSDAHIICASEEQAMEEIGKALDLIEYVAGYFWT